MLSLRAGIRRDEFRPDKTVPTAALGHERLRRLLSANVPRFPRNELFELFQSGATIGRCVSTHNCASGAARKSSDEHSRIRAESGACETLVAVQRRCEASSWISEVSSMQGIPR